MAPKKRSTITPITNPTLFEMGKLEEAGKVTVFGDTAIATGGFMAKGTDASGKPMDIHERWTDTWVKMPSGKWECVATHGSAIQM